MNIVGKHIKPHTRREGNQSGGTCGTFKRVASGEYLIGSAEKRSRILKRYIR